MTAMAIGFGVVITALAAVGVLQGAELGDSRQQIQVTTALGIVAWVLASLTIRRRAA
jgi:hypothetical protein